MGLSIHLVVLRADQQVGQYQFDADSVRTVKIGRLSTAQVRLEDAKCARIHAVIELSGPDASLIDMGSPGGTAVQGEKVSRVVLKHGDAITVGDTTLWVGLGAPFTPHAAVVADPVQPAVTSFAPQPAVAGMPRSTPAAAALQTRQSASGAAGQSANFSSSSASALSSTSSTSSTFTPASPAAAFTLAPVERGAMAASAPFGPAHPDPTAGRRLTQERLTKLAGSVSRPVGLPEEDALTATNRVLELRFYWGEVLLGMYHYARPKQVTIGESKRSDIFLSSEGLPQQAFPLIRYQDGTYMLRCTSTMEGEVQTDGVSSSLAEARKKLGTADASLADTYQIPMPQDMRVLLHWGGATFAMRFVPPAKLLPAPFGKNIDFGYLNVMVMSLVLHLGLIITLAIYPHDTDALKVDLFGEPDRFAQLILEAPKETQATQDLLEKIKKQVEVKQIEIREPNRKPEAKEVVRPLDVKSPMKNMPRPQKTAAEKKADVAKRFANLLGGGPGKAGGAGNILGGGGGGSLAGSLQNVIGTAGTGSASAGMAGLGVRGSGPLTGGGLGQSRGIGGIGTSGRLGGGGAGYGAGVGLGAGKARNTIDFETPQVEGALAADVIKRVINENKNQVRYCYEVELQRNQNLEGRVLVRWIIGGTGSVIVVSIKESSLHNAAVETCLMNKIKGWKFPAPAGGGTVEVNYPFVFKAS